MEFYTDWVGTEDPREGTVWGAGGGLLQPVLIAPDTRSPRVLHRPTRHRLVRGKEGVDRLGNYRHNLNWAFRNRLYRRPHRTPSLVSSVPYSSFAPASSTVRESAPPSVRPRAGAFPGPTFGPGASKHRQRRPLRRRRGSPPWTLISSRPSPSRVPCGEGGWKGRGAPGPRRGRARRAQGAGIAEPVRLSTRQIKEGGVVGILDETHLRETFEGKVSQAKLRRFY